MIYAEVIGDPIAHSRSPDIHGAWLKQLGIAADYRRTRVEADGVADYVTARRGDTDWRGCNVTLPHKLAVPALADSCGQEVVAIGAANLLHRDGERLVARNLDAEGFLRPLKDIDLSGAHACVIGAGGASRAVLYGLKDKGIARVTILNRTLARAEDLRARFDLTGESRDIAAPLPPADILVNTSALGMTGQPQLSLDLGTLLDHTIVYDIVYTPLETDLLAAARARGLRAIDGLGMLIGQAAASFPLLFGQHVPDDDSAIREMLTP
ncbi:MAG: shikimate dehydrogenase [Pacificimonas sp.]